MLFPPIPKDEVDRIEALHSLDILDSSPDIRYDCITRFAATKLSVPIVLITFIDSERQWFKSAWGTDASEVSRDISICAHAICETTDLHPSGKIYEVSDTKEDSRFFDNPLVVDEPKVRSYISYSLQSEFKKVGTLCLVDRKPRKFNLGEIELIVELGSMIEDLLKPDISAKLMH